MALTGFPWEAVALQLNRISLDSKEASISTNRKIQAEVSHVIQTLSALRMGRFQGTLNSTIKSFCRNLKGNLTRIFLEESTQMWGWNKARMGTTVSVCILWKNWRLNTSAFPHTVIVSKRAQVSKPCLQTVTANSCLVCFLKLVEPVMGKEMLCHPSLMCSICLIICWNILQHPDQPSDTHQVKKRVSPAENGLSLP